MRQLCRAAYGCYWTHFNHTTSPFPIQPPQILPRHPQHSLMARMNPTTTHRGPPSPRTIAQMAWPPYTPPMTPPLPCPHLSGAAALQGLQEDEATCPVHFLATVRALLFRWHHLQWHSIHRLKWGGGRGRTGTAAGGSYLTLLGGSGACWTLSLGFSGSPGLAPHAASPHGVCGGGWGGLNPPLAPALLYCKFR